MADRAVKDDQIVSRSWKLLDHGIKSAVADIGSGVVFYGIIDSTCFNVDRIDMSGPRGIKALCQRPIAATNIENIVPLADYLGREECTSECVNSSPQLPLGKPEQGSGVDAEVRLAIHLPCPLPPEYAAVVVR